METLKNAVGLGDANTTTANNETKGQEPVSGVTGAGTADQPYDSGNVEDSHLAGESANSTTADDKNVAAPLKALAPGGGILSTLASAVGLQSSTTSNNATVTEQQGQEPVSGMTGEGTADQPYDAGNSEDSTLGGKAAQHTGAAPGVSGVEQSSAAAREQDPATTNEGLQFVGISSAADTQSSHGAGTQQHSSIKEAVAEGALGGKEDPAQSNKGLAFVTAEVDKQPTGALEPKTSNHGPVEGTAGAYTKKEESSNSVEPRPEPVKQSEPVGESGDKAAKSGSTRISSLFSNPFAKRESVSGASGETDLDPKAKAPAGSDPLPALGEHSVPVKVAKEKRPLPTQSSPVQQAAPVANDTKPAVVEPKLDSAVRPPNHLGADVPPGAASPKRDKGKGKVYGDSDTNSTRSSLTRTTSVGTTQTSPSTLDSRRFSTKTAGRIPTAGGIVLGEKASIERERRASLAPSRNSVAISEHATAPRDSLQKVNEDSEMPAPLTALPPVTQARNPDPPAHSNTDSPAALKNPETKASPNTTSGRIPGTERGSLGSRPPATGDGSRFAEQGLGDPVLETSTPQTTSERKPSLVSRIGRKLKSPSSKTSKASA
ncbi:hypothetical protein CB0940_03371 [Cercospora beticola]|uniref:Uncharacterized protein n=1 Tax=Cercospora beticola TaxID=122368 RepID=A0A2G5I433_CERBT|nr:hypothetical protein CB0940_03371 [Cercospora beticola]PIA99564.1 hypothetical protein CB0940_03371 [Cercospora beticola]WPB00547.1 hypothetical protein RHO25_005167 [Cercospora beticola]CAK1361236.1 unnamed protein product [Cercospora beticola]